jgi:hypothetical protein
MNRLQYRTLAIALGVGSLLGLPSCGHEQELVGITVTPTTETFGAATIPVSADAGLTVQLKALGTYIHPPVTKDITDKVTWSSNTPGIATVETGGPTAGLVTAQGIDCGNAIVSAAIVTNHSEGGISSSGAQVSATMTATVVCGP